MEREIAIVVGAISAQGKLFDTPTADAVWQALPFESSFDFWGDEIYFTVPVSLGLEENAQEIVDKGDLGYWPSGPSFCIFFGPTPISKGKEIRPASKVNVFGRIKSDPEVFKKASSRERIRVDRS
jgi:hypothetical protein